MSRREKERKDSLAALGRIASSVGGGAPAPPKPPGPPRSTLPPRPPPPKPAPPPPLPALKTDADRARRAKQAERAAKREEERLLRERRQNELARSTSLPWRGMALGDVPTSIRRTGFDRQEPSLGQKIDDILGAAKEKEGRAKARDKGRRQGGR